MNDLYTASATLLLNTHGESQLSEVLEFMRLLWAVAHGMQSLSKQMKSKLGVTGRQRLVLRLVGQFPGITATRLAGLLHIHPSTLSGVVKRLVKQGYLERQEDSMDTRRAFLRLTPAGRALDVPSAGTVEAAVQRLLLRVSEEQRLAAQALLTALAAELLAGREAEPWAE
jgi:DNA-binding MarR family transcriptional regulator